MYQSNILYQLESRATVYVCACGGIDIRSSLLLTLLDESIPSKINALPTTLAAAG